MIRKWIPVLWSVLALALSAAVGTAQQTLELNAPINARYEDEPVLFVVNAEENQTVLIVVTSQEADLGIEVYDELGAYVAGDDDSGDGINPALGINFPQAGQYSVFVVSYSRPTGGSDFTILMQPLEIVAEAEVVLGQIVRGVIGDTFPSFTFTVERETTLLISPLTFNFAPQLTLLTEGGEVVTSTELNLLRRVVPPGRYRLNLSAPFDGHAPRPYYALLITDTAVEALTFNETQTVNAVGERARFYTFEGRAGDVVDIVVSWPLDARSGMFFSVVAPSGEPVFFSETTASTSFVNGAVLPEDGVYQVEVLPFTTTFRSPFTLFLGEGDVIEVSATPTTVVIDMNVVTRQLVAEVVEGRTYRLTVTTDNPARPFSVFAGVDISLNVFGGRAGAIEFVASSSGTLSMSLRADSIFFGDEGAAARTSDATLTITFEEVNQ